MHEELDESCKVHVRVSDTRKWTFLLNFELKRALLLDFCQDPAVTWKWTFLLTLDLKRTFLVYFCQDPPVTWKWAVLITSDLKKNSSCQFLSRHWCDVEMNFFANFGSEKELFQCIFVNTLLWHRNEPCCWLLHWWMEINFVADFWSEKNASGGFLSRPCCNMELNFFANF